MGDLIHRAKSEPPFNELCLNYVSGRFQIPSKGLQMHLRGSARVTLYAYRCSKGFDFSTQCENHIFIKGLEVEILKLDAYFQCFRRVFLRFITHL